MKAVSSKLFLLFIVILRSSSTAYADCWTKVRPGCTWLYNKFKAHANIKKLNYVERHCSDTRAGCNVAETRVCQYPDPLPGNPFQVLFAYSYAKVDHNSNYIDCFGYYDGTFQWTAGSDVSKKIPDLSFQPMVEKMNFSKDRKGGGKMSSGNIDFDFKNHTVRITDIQGVFHT
jgi:hypothetical protein